MSATAFTPGPLKVVLDGTMTGVWAEVRQECVDPETQKAWERELCRSNTVYVRREDAYPQHGSSFRPFEEAPEQFRPDDDHEETLANARLWASAPELYDALEAVRQWFMGYTANFGTDVAEEIALIDGALAKARGEQ